MKSGETIILGGEEEGCFVGNGPAQGGGDYYLARLKR